MKKITLIILLLTSAKIGLSQTWKIGFGVQTLSQPLAGAFIEADHNSIHNEKFETITRLSLGFRNQNQTHNAATLELHRGYRVKFADSYYVEQLAGIGLMQSMYSERYWHVNDWSNLVYVGSDGRKLDIVPSVSIGLGRHFGGEQGNTNHLWVRPKVFFQLPANQPSNPNFTLQFGFSRSLSK